MRAERNRPAPSPLLSCVSRFRWGRRLCTERRRHLTKLGAWATQPYRAGADGDRAGGRQGLRTRVRNTHTYVRHR
ncbi:protein of unknown function [Streptomyces sp. KY75]|nr:protein of unknown function [Streptomyces sp. KY75]CAD5986849.1 protein of unknown function [Streptomyces sp. KY70]